MNNSKKKSSKVSFFKRIENKFRYGLVFQTLRNKLAKIGIEITPYYWVEEGISNLEIPTIKGELSEYFVEFINAKDIKLIVENARGYSEEELISWLDHGKSCLALKHLNEIVAFFWINFKECTFEPCRFSLKSNEVYLADMFTMESHRGKNLAVFLRFKSYEILKNMGRDKIYSVCEFFNSSAIKYKKKLKGKIIKLVLYIRLFHKLSWSIKIRSFN
jgi:hypothetical protein